MKTELVKLKERYTRRAELLERFAELEASDPAFIEEFLREVVATSRSAAATDAGVDGADRRKVTVRDKVAAFFKSRQNEWATTVEIRRMTGVGDGNLANILYGENSAFESRPNPKHATMKLWRVREHSQNGGAHDR